MVLICAVPAVKVTDCVLPVHVLLEKLPLPADETDFPALHEKVILVIA